MRYQGVLRDEKQGHAVLLRGWDAAKPLLAAGTVLDIVICHQKRNNAQNALLWASLGEIARQVDWHGQKLAPEEWKDCFTAALKRQKVVPGLDGGFVVLGSSTSKMTKSELSELLELMFAFAAERGVKFPAPLL